MMSSRGRRRGASGRSSRFGPGVERLEPKQLLATFPVTSAADNGSNLTPTAGSLREAILLANANPGEDRIEFAIGTGSQTIAPPQPLPGLTDPIVIDATSQPGFDPNYPRPLIRLDGASAGLSAEGLVFDSGASGSTVRGLAIVEFDGNGIEINSGGVVVQGNHIGVDRLGTTAVANGGHGIRIEGGSGSVIGGSGPGEGNLISGNAINGIDVIGSTGNVIAGNRIGTSIDGSTILANGNQGVRLRDGSVGNTIGGQNATAFELSSGNLISGNGSDEVRIIGPGTSGNLVVGNFLGVNGSGNAPLTSPERGVELNRSSGNTVGGTDPRLGNLVSGNQGDGILIRGSGASNNLIQGNRIGTDATGSFAIPNIGEDGIEINGGVSNTIGGAEAGAGNLISGNGSDGIELESTPSGNLIQGNFIGTDASGTLALPNQANGVRLVAELVGGSLVGATDNTIGGTNANAGTLTAGNLISGNGGHGVQIIGAASSGNAVLGNFVGTDVTGSLALGNANHGILLDGGSGNTIGGENIGLQPWALRSGNLVSGNGEDGIRLAVMVDGQGSAASVSSSNLVLGNFVGSNTTGTAAVPNAGAGIAMIGDPNPAGTLSGNTIGGVNDAGPGATRGNLISGNARVGLLLRGGAVSGNLARGNRIGSNATGTAALPNGRAPSSAGPIDPTQGIGVLIDQGAVANSIGSGNVISGNIHSGVVIDASASNVVRGSRIGTSAAGDAAIGNGIGEPLPGGATDPTELDGNGVFLRNGASGNTIGGSNADPDVLSDGNLVSGNLGDGIAVHGSGSSANLIAGNRIGTTIDGNAGLGNGLDGVEIAGALGSTIGGVSSGLRNVISGNGSDGIELERGASNTSVFGNFIGSNASGTDLVGNADVGVSVFDASDNGIIGNLISGNFDGVRIRDAISTPDIPTLGNLVVSNFIGTDATGSMALGNRDDGVQIVASSNNTVGGETPGEGNLISGNASNGVVLGDAATATSGNLVLGNRIGTDASGTLPLGNGEDGVLLARGATANTIGGVNPGPSSLSIGNLISGNGGSGIRVRGEGAGSNLMLGNVIGTDATGSSAIGNAVDGIRIEARPSNTIGGTNANAGTLTAGNLVSGNLGAGIRLIGEGASGNIALGNFVGLDALGSVALGNRQDGIRLEDAPDNTIGAPNGSSEGSSRILTAGNLVSGNLGDGVVVDGPAASGNRILGNFVGIDAPGTAPVGNAGAGVRISGPGNSVGEPGDGAGNVISANLGDGLAISSPSTSVLANLIGTDATGSADLGNLGDGVRISSAMMNTIGANAEGSRNVVSGNRGSGVRITGEGASLNIVAGNRIGTDREGSAALGNLVGVLVTGGASNNAIGGGNVLSGNLEDGVRIEGGAGENAVAGNFIGLGPDGSTAMGNGRDGARIDGSSNNTIAGNIASSNVGFGVSMLGPESTGTVLQSNRIGTGDAGLLRRGNGSGGILLLDAPGNLVGGLVAAEGNIVSANLGSGIEIRGSSASGNLVAGNVVGLDATGMLGLGNSADGIVLLDGASGNTIGGEEVAAGNVVSGNARDGVVIAEGSTRNVLSGNLIGSDASGGAAIGNGSSGVRISDSPDNTVGGRVNLISGNGAFGVAIAGGLASGNLVAGNLIGTDLSGGSILGSQRVGVVILNAPGNVVSGGNLIAGHLEDGIQLIGEPASGNLVEGNFIGTDETARSELGNVRGLSLFAASGNEIRSNVVSGNLGDGLVLLLGASGNVVSDNLIGLAGEGGSVMLGNTSGVLVVGADGNRFEANTIGGNRGFGIALAGASGNVVSDNRIGVDPTGSSPRPNDLHGLMVLASSNNSISGNVVSGNRLSGMELRAGSTGNLLSENLIGTNRDATAAIGNARDGIHLDGSSRNRLQSNVVSGNLGNGVTLVGDAPENVLVDNVLGTDGSGSASIGNRGSGVLVLGASNNAMLGNVSSGNLGFGVGIVGGSGNVVSEGFVGTDRSGSAALGNGLIGVFVFNSSRNFVINSVVSANGSADSRGNVRIEGPGAVGNQVLGNRIGTDRDGSRSLDPDAGGVLVGDPGFPADGTPSSGERATFDPRNDGVVIADQASENSVGGVGEGQGNLISGNRIGVFIRGRSGGNVLLGNRIGTDAPGSSALPNGDGVIVMNSSGNSIGGDGQAARNVISGNLETGIRLTSIAFDEPRAPAVSNVILGNFIGTNASGDAAIGNRQGVFVYGGAFNQIGQGRFDDPGFDSGGNLISGNREVGVQILNADTINARTVSSAGGPRIEPNPAVDGAVSSGNIVSGNRVGSNADGTSAIPNYQGVFISDAPGNAVIDNLIGGNVQVGLNLTAFNTVSTFVGGNRIGPDLLGNLGPMANGFGDPNGLGTGLLLNQVVDGANTIAPTNDIRGNTGSQTRTRSIASGPFVEGIIPVVDPDTGALTRVDVRINGYLDRDASRTLNPGNAIIEPIGSGPVGISTISYDEVARILSITPSSPLPPGSSFRLTLIGQAPGGLRSRPGPGASPAFLDGNLDGRAGDNFDRVVTVPARSGTAGAALTASAVDALLDLDDLS